MKTNPFNKFILAATLVLPLGHTAHAQPAAAPAAGQVGLSLSSEVTGSGQARLKAGDKSYSGVTLSNAAVALGQAIPFGEDGSFSIGIGYDTTDIRVEDPEGWKDDPYWKAFKRDNPNWKRVPLPSELQSLSFSLSHSQKLNDQWSLSSTIAAGSHVAKTGLLSKGWGANASVVGLYTWDSSLTFAIGLAYDSLSHDLKLVPVLGCEWRPAEKWSVAIGFPKTAVSYTLNKKLTMSLAASGSGGTYYIQDDPLPGAAPRSLSDSKMEYMEARLGFCVDWRINQTFSLSLTSGEVLYREFKYVDRNFKLRSRDVVPFSTIGVSISL